MDVMEIVKDAATYPTSDLKKYVMLGMIMMITNLFLFTPPFVDFVTAIIGLIINFLVLGYVFKIIKSSLGGENELPPFKSWMAMFIDGIKVSLIIFVYALPSLLLIILSLGIFIPIIYLIVVIPILLMAITNMAYNNGQIIKAFRLNEIIHKISTRGWKNLILLYIVMLILFLVIYGLGAFLTNLFSLIMTPFIGIISASIILIPYSYIYIARSSALFFVG